MHVNKGHVERELRVRKGNGNKKGSVRQWQGESEAVEGREAASKGGRVSTSNYYYATEARTTEYKALPIEWVQKKSTYCLGERGICEGEKKTENIIPPRRRGGRRRGQRDEYG